MKQKIKHEFWNVTYEIIKWSSIANASIGIMIMPFSEWGLNLMLFALAFFLMSIWLPKGEN